MAERPKAKKLINFDAIPRVYPESPRAVAHQADILYVLYHSNVNIEYFDFVEIESTTDSTVTLVNRRSVNVEKVISGEGVRDMAVYGDTGYLLTMSSVYTFDIRPYRPMRKNTKTTIYPVFATNGDTIPLKQYAPDAKEIHFAVGSEKISFLTINANAGLEIANDAVTETTPVLVRLTGINYIDSADFEFYLVIQSATAPVWRDVDSLTMRAGSQVMTCTRLLTRIAIAL